MISWYSHDIIPSRGPPKSAPGKRAMLADFGVAGQVEHTEDLRRSIVGTPAFMSPEMLEGRPYNSHLAVEGRMIFFHLIGWLDDEDDEDGWFDTHGKTWDSLDLDLDSWGWGFRD